MTTYTLLILIRNNVAGFHAVPNDVLEAAEGMGYTRRERLLRVELPLAVPLILAGVRLASVTLIGLATVVAVLGNSFGGSASSSPRASRPSSRPSTCSAPFLSVALAFAADALFVLLERSRHALGTRPGGRR